MLMSFYYFAGFDLDRIKHMRVVGDSGAYSARSQGVEISLDDLGKWGAKWRHRLFWLATLDVSGNVKQTRQNFLYLQYEYGLDTIPSIHQGDDPRELDWFADRGVDFLGLGGVAGGVAKNGAVMRWLVAVFRYAQKNHPEMRFHGWGMTTRTTRVLPFWSVDSSSWGSSYRYGVLNLRNPVTGKTHTIKTNGRDAFKPENARLLMDHYDVDPSRVAVSTSETRPDIVRVSALSQAVWEEQMRRMHRPGVTAPKWGIMNDMGLPTTGPHAILADSSTKNIPTLDGVRGEYD